MTHTVDTLVSHLDGGAGGVSTDSQGNIYVADFGKILGDQATMGTQVFKITPEGESTVFAEGFEGASGNEFDSEGNLFQSNIRGGFISKITPDGEVSVFAAEGLEGPVGIVIDNADTLYVANCSANSIQKITKAGESTQFVESPLLNCPNGLTLDESGNLYAANFNNGDVIKIDSSGHASRLVTLPGENNGHLVYRQGFLYVVARTAHQIYKVSLSGEANLFAGTGEKGSQDGAALEASFCYPNDIDISPDGNIFYFNDVVNLSTDGKLLGPMAVRRILIDREADD